MNGIPKTRPIVGASSGLTTYIGDFVSDLIEPLAKKKPDSTEAQSTEKVRRIIKDASTKTKEEGCTGQ